MRTLSARRDLILILAGTVLLGILLGAMFHGSPSAYPRADSEQAPQPPTAPAATNAQAPPTTTATETPPVPEPETTERDQKAGALANNLDDGVAEVERLGLGTARIALMFDDDARPLVRGSSKTASGRTWSLIKPVTATAVLALRGTSEGLMLYMTAALRRSENCAQRRLVLELQRLAGGEERAKAMLRAVLGQAGGNIDTAKTQANESGAECRTATYQGLSASDATQRALLVGTTEWSLSDAVLFIHALRSGTYGPEAAEVVLGLMRQPKLPSREPGAGAQDNVNPSWGAGEVFTGTCWNLAYKGGWGRSESANFTASQMGTVELGEGHWVAFAVTFDPKVEPPDSDPSKARAPEALRAALTPLERGLQKARTKGCATK